MLGGSLTQGGFTNRIKKPAELMLVPMIDIFTVLVTFLLMTAVFSRITIMELELPSADGGPATAEPEFRLEVILRSEGFELTNGTAVIATVPKAGGEYDLAALSKLAQSLKLEHPDVDDASILLEPRVEYDDLIQVMDAIRSAEKPADGGVATVAAVNAGTDGARPERVALFTDIALGDAP
jgi:biopolymer transport protein ExbD